MASNMKLKGILFDLDGTLVDFKIDYKRARDATIQVLEGHGFPRGELSADMLIIEMMQLAEKYFFTQKGASQAKWTQIKGDVDQDVELVERDAAHQASKMAGITQLLDFLVQNGVKLGVITYNTTPNALITLEVSGLAHYFPDKSIVIGRDLVTNPKPHPVHAHRLLDLLGLSPQDICIIGDNPRDIEAANKIGSRSIAIRDPKHAREEYLTEYCFERSEISEIINVIKKFLNS